MGNKLPTSEEEVRATYAELNRATGRGLTLLAIGLCAFAIASRFPDTSWLWITGRLTLITVGGAASLMGTGVIWVAKDRERSLKRLGLSDESGEG